MHNIFKQIVVQFYCKHFLMQVAKARDVGVNSVVLFPKVPDALKVFTLIVFCTTSRFLLLFC